MSFAFVVKFVLDLSFISVVNVSLDLRASYPSFIVSFVSAVKYVSFAFVVNCVLDHRASVVRIRRERVLDLRASCPPFVVSYASVVTVKFVWDLSFVPFVRIRR